MIELAITFNKQMLEELNKLPMLIQHKVADKCMPAMARPIVAKAKLIGPSSRQSGTRKKWGKNRTYKDGKVSFDPVKWAENDSRKAIGSRVFKGSNAIMLYVGGQFPRGNKLQYSFGISKKGIPTQRKVFYWGKEQGTTYKPPERFLDRAADETRTQQQSAFETALEQAAREYK